MSGVQAHGEVSARAVKEPARRTPQSWSTWWGLVKAAGSSWVADYAPSMGAALSYYSVFSLAPLLLLVISIAGLVFGEDAVRGEVFAQLQGLLGPDAAGTIESVLASASAKPAEGIFSTVAGLVLLLVGATTVFGELQDALDRIWRAPVRDRTGGLWALLRSRMLSFGMVLGIAFLLMVSLVMSAAVSALGKWWSGAFGSWELLAQALNMGVGFVLTTGVFAMIYKIMPRVKVEWHDVWIGAAVTALLFTFGRFLIGLYIGKSGVASSFGAAGSLIVVFVWVYYSAQIFLVGAEFTWVYAKTFGSMRHTSSESKSPTLIPNAGSATGATAAPTKRPPASARAPQKPLAAALKQVGLTVAIAIAVKYVVPKLIVRVGASWLKREQRALAARLHAPNKGTRTAES